MSFIPCSRVRTADLAPQLFLGTEDKVYIVDKVENNPTQIKGHPAWASGMFRSLFFGVLADFLPEYALGANTQRAMDAVTNSFCAVSPCCFVQYYLADLCTGRWCYGEWHLGQHWR